MLLEDVFQEAWYMFMTVPAVTQVTLGSINEVFSPYQVVWVHDLPVVEVAGVWSWWVLGCMAECPVSVVPAPSGCLLEGRCV